MAKLYFKRQFSSEPKRFWLSTTSFSLLPTNCYDIFGVVSLCLLHCFVIYIFSFSRLKVIDSNLLCYLTHGMKKRWTLVFPQKHDCENEHNRPDRNLN